MHTNYYHAFTHLHTATGRTHWGAATRHSAPNKPLLLLTVIDLFAQGLITANLIESAGSKVTVTGHHKFGRRACSRPVTVTCPTPKALIAHHNIAGHLLTLHERPLVAPVDGALWPDREALRWHREQCLRH